MMYRALMVLWLACASSVWAAPASTTAQRQVKIERTAHGLPHIEASDHYSLAYGVAYAYATDNACALADYLVTARGQRSKFFGAEAKANLGLRDLPNAQIDFFIQAHMNDEALAQAWRSAGAEAQQMAEGYVAGYNHYWQQAKPACAGQSWVQPMTLVDYYRIHEVLVTQAGITALADAWLGATPPVAKPQAQLEPSSNEQVLAALTEAGAIRQPWGSNAWAFGKDTSANGKGLLLGNPHFPWVGTNRMYQMHLKIPGKLDVMGAAIAPAPYIQLGFNRDVAWSHTVSIGKRFTLYELKLVEGKPTEYMVDGQPEAMTSQVLNISHKLADGSLATLSRTVWRSRFGPVIVIPRAGLNWTATTAYALADANTLNTRTFATWLEINRARNVEDIRAGLKHLGTPWVNTIAADRHGQVLYADASVVPDVPPTLLKSCLPSPRAAALNALAGLVVMDGSRQGCRWQQDASSAKPGLVPIERLPVLVRSDWVQNSNDSFWLSQPQHRWGEMSDLIGAINTPQKPRTRAALDQIGHMVAAGPVTAERIQQQLFSNHNFMGQLLSPDLVKLCAEVRQAEAVAACQALSVWDRRNNLHSRSAHLFREFWRQAANTPKLWAVAFDPADPVNTPRGFNLAQPEVKQALEQALVKAAQTITAAGLALDAPLAQVQFRQVGGKAIGIHGGDEFEGVLNKVETKASSALSAQGYAIDYGTSYVQTVGFDQRGPVAQALLVYGQGVAPDSPLAYDQLPAYSNKQWLKLPFHPNDVRRQRQGKAIVLKP